MEHNSIKIEDILTTEYSDFLEFCSAAGKTFVSELTNVDYIAFRSGYGQSKNRVNEIKDILNSGKPLGSIAQVIEETSSVQEEQKCELEADCLIDDCQTEKNTVINDDYSHDEIIDVEEESESRTRDNKTISSSFETSDRSLSQEFNIDPLLFENVGIDKLVLSVRSTNCLYRSDYKTIADLLRLRVFDLQQIRNMGAKSVKEVVSVLKEFVLNYTQIETPEPQTPVKFTPNLKTCIEAYLLGESYDVLSLNESEQLAFSKSIISAETIGKEICLFALRNCEYTSATLKMLLDFAKPHIVRRSRIESVQKQLAKKDATIRNKKLLPFIRAYEASTKHHLNELVAVCDRNTTVLSIPTIFESINVDEKNDKLSNNISMFLQWLPFDIETTVKDVSQRITNSVSDKNARSYEIFSMRNAGKTLEEIGQAFGVTRERIRQIEAKLHRSFWRTYNAQHYDLIMLIYALRDGDEVLYFEEVKEYVGDFSEILWSCAKKLEDNEFYYYEKEIDAIVINGNANIKKGDKLVKNINSAIKALPGIIYNSQYDATITEISSRFSIPVETLQNHAQKRYKLDGQFYHDSRLTVPFMCSYVLKERFPSGFKIADEYEGNRFKGYLVEFFGDSGKSITHRALDAKVCDVGCLCDRGKYVHPDFVVVDQSYIDAINDYVEKSPRNAISFAEVYEALKNRFAGTQISNRYALQGALKKYGCKYQTTRDLIRKKDSVTMASELESFVMERGCAHISEILAEFIALNEISFQQVAARCPGILYQENGYYFHDSLLDIVSTDYDEIRPFLVEICEKMPIHSKVLFDEFEIRFSDFMLRNEVDSHNKLFSILAYMFGEELSFSRPYVAKENANIASIRKNLLQLLENYDYLSVDEVLDISNENNITYNSVTAHIQWLAPEWIKVDAETIVRREYTGITDDIIEEVEIIVSEMLESAGYVIASSVNDFIWFPEIEIAWSSHIVECILKATKKIRCIYYPFNRHGKPSTIYVSDTYKDYSYESFIVSILAKELKRGAFSKKEDIREWLVEKDLIDSGLPKFLREDKYFYYDERGVLKIREEN